MNQTEYTDVIVIGGGLSGLVAARELRENGHSVLVLERRDRLGGRVWSTKFPGYDFEELEMGGAYFDTNTHIRLANELARYNIETKKDEGERPRHHWYLGGKLQRGGFPIPAEQLPGFERVVFELIRQARRIDPTVPFDDQDLAGLEQPFSQFLEQLEIGTETKDFLEAMGAFFAGAAPDRLPTLHIVDWIAQMDFSVWSQWAVLGETFHLGSSRLVDALEQELEGQVRLSTSVRAIDVRNDSEVQVHADTTDGEVTFRAGRAILACPVEAWEHLEFTPPLEANRIEALQAGHQVTVLKFWAVLSGVSEPFIAVGSGALNWLSSTEFSDGKCLSVGFIGVHESLDPNDYEALSHEIHQLLPEATLEDVFWHNWNTDPASGAVSYRPRYQRVLRQPHGRLHFAGSDLATNWPAWIEGALESGLEVSDSLNREISAASVPQPS